jgi:hypothetical protein
MVIPPLGTRGNPRGIGGILPIAAAIFLREIMAARWRV